MDKSGALAPPSIESSRDLQCVGKMEIVKPKPAGFLCGSIPVPTDKSFHAFNSALVPSSRQTVSAPRYRMLPTETDLNRPPLVTNWPEKVLPIGAVQSKVTGDILWEDGAIASNLRSKCEALAVSGLVEYGDVIAPADVLKQIFKIPYSRARLSIAVHRVGQTLVLNSGPDIEEGEKLVRRHNNHSKCTDQSLFLNFAMHSVTVEACDCPPTHQAPLERQSDSSVFPGESHQILWLRMMILLEKRDSSTVQSTQRLNKTGSFGEARRVIETRAVILSRRQHMLVKSLDALCKSLKSIEELAIMDS